MSQGFSQLQRRELGLSVRIDPRMVLRSKLLELNLAELEQAIEVEVTENPALERLELSDPFNDQDVYKSIAPSELRVSGEWWEGKRCLSDDETTSWVELTPSSTTLKEHLLAALLPQLPKTLKAAGEWAIASLDDRGYLDCFEEDIALGGGCSLEEAAAVIRALQRCEPPGIGASDLRQCLLLQLRGAVDTPSRVARAMIRDHWDDFVGKKYEKLSRKMAVLPDLIQAAYTVVSGLHPHPAEGFSPEGPSSFSERAPSISPDLIFLRTEFGWKAEAPGTEWAQLRIDRFYKRRLAELSAAKGVEAADERRHLSTYVKRAEEFIESLKSRETTLMMIGGWLIRNQQSFLATGDYTFLNSSTRAQMASDLGLHESTVSRATAGKFVALPSGELISFDVFFKPALRIQKLISDILNTENPSDPMTDERISELLAKKGIQIARRTVHKYRDKERLLSSRRRRVA